MNLSAFDQQAHMLRLPWDAAGIGWHVKKGINSVEVNCAPSSR